MVVDAESANQNWFEVKYEEFFDNRPNFWYYGDDNWFELSNIRKWHEPVDNPISTNYTQSGTQVTKYSKHWGLFGNTRNGSAHAGLDLFAKTGENIYACVDGTVYNRRWHGGYGNTITIKVDDPEGLLRLKRDYKIKYSKEGEIEKGMGFSERGSIYLFYAHLDSVKEFSFGEKVKMGDVLGTTGRSGVKRGTRAPH
ncbi:M23 family metallopeptidase, partial [Tenacibaculum sp. L6]|uniref:M23 family metallopeptidase n=1 Tax=Tenacibaculum sp. L6 TaxID=2992764 RepID=UPI00237BA5A0